MYNAKFLKWRSFLIGDSESHWKIVNPIVIIFFLGISLKSELKRYKPCSLEAD